MAGGVAISNGVSWQQQPASENKQQRNGEHGISNSEMAKISYGVAKANNENGSYNGGHGSFGEAKMAAAKAWQ